ncbi:MAG: hypothetical protein KDB27_16400 [Planctomycetales bacterium]|nr:hypothetical protein [Planctomycetales bacterium]
MPNHVTNKLTIESGARIVLATIEGENGPIDFDRVMPMPPELDIECSAEGQLGADVLSGAGDKYLSKAWATERKIEDVKGLKKFVELERPQVLELGEAYLRNVEQYGHPNWYGWRLQHWGTKWNAYYIGEAEIIGDSAHVRFDTAWSPPLPVLDRLSKEISGAAFVLKYFDEGWGFAGWANFRNGMQNDECIEPNSNDSVTEIDHLIQS